MHILHDYLHMFLYTSMHIYYSEKVLKWNMFYVKYTLSINLFYGFQGN